jgi:kynurenine formamidase
VGLALQRESGIGGTANLVDRRAVQGPVAGILDAFLWKEPLLLEAAERAQGVTVGDGDILLVRTGHPRRLAELGPWDTAAARAGLHPTAMALVAERRVAVLGSDANSDTAPSTTEGVAFPIHVLAINAMGVRLLDYLQLEDLRQACAAVAATALTFTCTSSTSPATWPSAMGPGPRSSRSTPASCPRRSWPGPDASS